MVLMTVLVLLKLSRWHCMPRVMPANQLAFRVPPTAGNRFKSIKKSNNITLTQGFSFFLSFFAESKKTQSS